MMAMNRESKAGKKVIVAGAGIAGLCCAYELMTRGHDITVLEASRRTGGHVLTINDVLPDGLYADVGAECLTKPGHDRCLEYAKQFGLTVLSYHRKENVVRLIRGRVYTEQMLRERSSLNKLGFNGREIRYLMCHSWWDLPWLYFKPYLGSFPHEYRPFDAGLNHLDHIAFTDLLRKDDASVTAMRFMGSSRSALHTLWHAAIRGLRGIPAFPSQYRIKNGNQKLPDAFAARLGRRIQLGCAVTGIEYGDTGVSVRYREGGRQKKVEADFLVCCMSAGMLAQIPAMPPWPEAKAYALRNVPYYTETRVVFQSRTHFWEKDAISPNIEFRGRTLWDVWRMADEIPTSRGILVGSARARTLPSKAATEFRRAYPGTSEDIERTMVKDWARDHWAFACDTLAYKPGQLAKVWPYVIEPVGRVHFAGAYADNLNWGMEAAVRSANRVTEAIHGA
jgi:monoamine oxidase